jgi:hypothetical protein
MLKISNPKIGYRVNTMGYRAKEFDTIDWSNSYIIQGCSACFGAGIPDDSHTIAEQLSNRLQAPVINLGVSGGSIELQYFNTIEMLEQGIRPKGVFIMWPNADRFPLFNQGILENCGSWSDDKKLEWAMNGNSAQHNLYHGRAVTLMWKLQQVPLITFGHHHHAVPYVDCHLLERFDWGTDGEHWGPKTAEYIAEMLYQKHLSNPKSI